MISLAVAGLALLGCIITAVISLRGQTLQAKTAEEASNREDFWKLLAERNTQLASIKADYEQLRALYNQQAERLESLESQRIKDQIRIQDLETRIKTLGGTL